MDEGTYFCQHCDGVIESLDEACNHECFRGEEYIYQSENDSRVLYVKKNESDDEQTYKNEDIEIHNASSSGNRSNRKEDFSDSEDTKTGSNAKKSAEWTKRTTMAMLGLYKTRIHILEETGKRSHVWKQVSDGLKDLGIEVTADQVKWKFNRLYTKYKDCIDNNTIGRSHMTFEYYEKFEEIFRKDDFLTSRKRKYEVIEPKIRRNRLYFNDSPKIKKNLQRFQSLKVLKQIQESQRFKNEKMFEYLKMKEKAMELKKKAVHARSLENDELRFLEKRRRDLLKIEKLKNGLLNDLLKNPDSDESD